MDAELEAKEIEQATPPAEDMESAATSAEGAETSDSPVEEQEEVKAGEDGEQETVAPKKDGVQKRIAEITREKYDAIRDAAYWKGVAEARKGEAPKPAEDKPTESGPAYTPPEFSEPRPKLEDCEYDEQKLRDAELAWVAKKATHDAYYKAKAEIEESNRRRDAETRLATYTDWKRQGAAKYQDFEEVIVNTANLAPNGQVPEVMSQAVREVDNSHDVAYFLGKNPQEFQRIAALAPLKQAIEIAKVSEKLAAKKTVLPKKIPNAPPPLVPVKPNAAPTTPLEEMSTEDYMAYMDEREFGKREG